MTQDAEPPSNAVIRRLVRHCPTALRELVLREAPPRWLQRELAGRRAGRVDGDDLARVASAARGLPAFEHELLRLLVERNPFFLAPLELCIALPTKSAPEALSWLGWWSQPRASDLVFLAQDLLDEPLPEGLRWTEAGDDRVLVSGASPHAFLERAEREPLALAVDATRAWVAPIASSPEAREALEAGDHGRAMEALLSHEDSSARIAGAHLAAWSGDDDLVGRALERLARLPSAQAVCHALAVSRALASAQRQELETLVTQSMPLPDALRAIGLEAIGRGGEAVRLLVREQRDHDWLGVSSLALACAILDRHDVALPESATFVVARGWAQSSERARARLAIEGLPGLAAMRQHSTTRDAATPGDAPTGPTQVSAESASSELGGRPIDIGQASVGVDYELTGGDPDREPRAVAVEEQHESAVEAGLRPLLGELIAANQLVERAQAIQDFASLQQHAATAAVAKSRSQEEIRRFADAIGHDLPALPAIRTEADAAAYLRSVSMAHRSAAAAQREQALAAATTEFREAGEALPDDVADAPTASEVRQRLEHHRPRLLAVRFESRARQGARIPDELRGAVAPARRLDILLAAGSALPVGPWVSLLSDDADAIGDDRSRALDAVVARARAELEAGTAIPAALWALAHRIDNRRLAEAAARLLSSFSDVEPSRAALSELSALVGVESLPAALRISLHLDVLSPLEPGRRARELARFAIENPDDLRVALALCESLLAVGRPEQAWLVMDTYVRRDLHISRPRGWGEGMRMLLVERMDASDSPTSLLEQVLDWRSWVQDEDDLTVFFYLAVRLGRGREVTYGFPQLSESLRAMRPELVRSWIEPSLERRPSLLADDVIMRRWRAGHQAVVEWDAAIQKPSCYAAWGHARDYQVHFRAWLEERLSEGLTGADAAAVSPGDVIDAIRQRHSLPTALRSAADNMETYLAEQLGRIEAMRTALATSGERDLEVLRSHAEGPWVRRLRDEAARAGNSSPPVRKIYQVALRGTPDAS